VTEDLVTDPAPSKMSKRRRRLVSVAITLTAVGVFALVTKDYLLHARFQTVVEGKVYRSYQPSLDEQRAWTARYAIRTIISLRGDYPGLPMEQAAAKAAGVAFYSFSFDSLSQPSRDQLLRLIEVLDSAQRPILIHCQYGVDRTGVVSALAAMAVGGQSFKDARANLPRIRTTLSSHYIADVLDRYDQYCQAHSLDRDDWGTFKKWAAEVFD
jgi:protein tyrosine phosphatase (PTP) superfamily phosphohydrolase (DUF442 family)